MIHRSISHWGVFEEPDNREYTNVFIENDGVLSKVDDGLPVMISIDGARRLSNEDCRRRGLPPNWPGLT